MRNTYRILLFIIFLLIKLNILKISCVLNGHWGNDRLKSGHEDFNWGTDGETIGPPEPQNPETELHRSNKNSSR